MLFIYKSTGSQHISFSLVFNRISIGKCRNNVLFLCRKFNCTQYAKISSSLRNYITPSNFTQSIVPSNPSVYNISIGDLKNRDIHKNLTNAFRILFRSFTTYSSVYSSAYNPTRNILRKLEILDDNSSIGRILERENLTSKNFSILICELGRNPKNLPKVMSIWEWMKQNIKHLHPIHFAAMIDANSRANQLHTALKIAQEIKKTKIKPNLAVYNALIRTFGYSHQYDEAFKIFQKN